MSAFPTPFALGAVEPYPMTLPRSGQTVLVPRCRLAFQPWRGEPLSPDAAYGGKRQLDLDGELVFAELAILRLLQADGWDGVWVDTFRKRYRTAVPHRSAAVTLPVGADRRLREIGAERGRLAGCWDVYFWRPDAPDDVYFAEAKRLGKDRLRRTQHAWLEAALAVGMPPSRFLLVEWDTDPR